MKNYITINIFAWYFGGFDDLLKAFTLIVFIAIFAEAIVSIAKYNNLSRLTLTLFTQKILEYILVGAANLTDLYIVSGESQVRKLIILFYMVYETKRILNIANEMQLPTP